MEGNVLKILYGTTFDKKNFEDDKNYYAKVEMALNMILNTKGYLSKSGIEKVKIKFEFSKTSLFEEIENNAYDVVVTDGTITSVNEDGDVVRDGIGFGIIKNWLADKKNMRVIVVEEESSKGKAKIGRLFKELNYYDIVFKPEDLKWRGILERLAEVLINPRTARQALTEYGIEEYTDVQEYLRQNPWVLEGGKKPADESVSSYNNSSDNADNVSELYEDEKTESVEVEIVEEHEPATVEKTEENVDINTNKENSSNEAEEFEAEMSMDEIRAKMAESRNRFADFGEENVVEEFAESEEESGEEEIPAEEEPKNNEGFSFGSFSFGGMEENNDAGSSDVHIEVVEETNSEMPAMDFGVEAEEVREAVVEDVEEKKEEFSFEFINSEPEKEIFASTTVEEGVYHEVKSEGQVVPVYRGNSSNNVMPARGIIKSVVDYDTILIEFANDVEGMETLYDYRCIVKVRSGEKGRVEGGRYKSANITFDAYLDTVIDKRMVMMEVPEFDCEEKRMYLEGKESNFIFAKM